MRNKDLAQEYETHVEESRLTSMTFLGEPSEVFPYHFHSNSMRDRNRQILMNLHASHLREEFKRAVKNGPHKSKAEIESDRRDKKKIKAMGQFFSRKMAAKTHSTDDRQSKVVPNDKLLAVSGDDYDLTIRQLTAHVNRERLEQLNTRMLQEPVSYKNHKEQQEQKRKQQRKLQEKLIKTKLRDD